VSDGSSALWQLTLARVREFYREPAAVFWVYGFPLLMALTLGFAFRGKPAEVITVDVRAGTGAESLEAALKRDARFQVSVRPEDEARFRLRRAKTDLVVASSESPGGVEYWFDRNRAECLAARNAVDAVLVRAKAGEGVVPTTDHTVEEPGSRYIDFLLPGLLGMNLMGGGLFGVGFGVADMRVRKLLKRFVATPMRRRDFLLSVMLSRLLFTLPEVLILLAFGYLLFGVTVAGPFAALLVVIFAGGACFSGIGLLIASRAQKLETVSGLVNLCTLPMWLLSGVFFSSERFPDAVQPVIQALPLTALVNAMRGVMLDGKGVLGVGGELAILAAWGVVTFVLALRWFRWR